MIIVGILYWPINRLRTTQCNGKVSLLLLDTNNDCNRDAVRLVADPVPIAQQSFQIFPTKRLRIDCDELTARGNGLQIRFTVTVSGTNRLILARRGWRAHDFLSGGEYGITTTDASCGCHVRRRVRTGLMAVARRPYIVRGVEAVATEVTPTDDDGRTGGGGGRQGCNGASRVHTRAWTFSLWKRSAAARR